MLKVFLAKPEMLDGLIFLSCLCSLHLSALIFSGVVELYALIGHVLRVDPSIASLLGFVSDHRVVMILQVPREALEFAEMSINFRSGKFGYSICPIFSKGHAEIFREF